MEARTRPHTRVAEADGRRTYDERHTLTRAGRHARELTRTHTVSTMCFFHTATHGLMGRMGPYQGFNHYKGNLRLHTRTHTFGANAECDTLWAGGRAGSGHFCI